MSKNVVCVESCVKMSSDVNLKAIIAKCNNVDNIDCIIEAIINSIQANGNNILCKINTSHSNNIESIEIIDDGEGFNDKNIKNFKTLYAEHDNNENKIGCKGYGRIYYKKAFDIVEVCSFNSDENYKKVNFVFTDDDFTKTDNIELHTHTHKDNETSLLLLKPLKNSLFDIQFLNDYEKIFNNIYPYILLSGNQKIKIKFIVDNEEKYEINYNSIKDIEETKKTFQVNNEKFYLYYNIFKNKNNDAKKEDNQPITAICHSKRPVCSFGKEPLKISLSLNNYKGLFLLKSAWLDEQEIDEYHSKFNLDRNNEYWENIARELKKQLLVIIKEIIDKDKIKRDKKEYDYNGYIQQQKIDLLNKYPDCAEYINNYTSIGIVEDDDIILSAIEDTNDKEKKAIKNDSEVNKEELFACSLARYIRHRQEIIDKIENSFKDAKDKESYIHNLIVPKKSNNLKLYDNNLWLFDDKFLGYNEIYSDEELKKIVKADGKTIATNTNNMNDCKPDIVFFKNTSNGIPKIVIIELKRPNVSWDAYVKGDEQLRQYAEYLVQERKVCNQVYGFLLVSSEALKENNYENQTYTYIKKYTKIYSADDDIIFMKVDKLQSKGKDAIDIGLITTTFITSNSLITDAKTRNQTFIDILNGKYIKEIKNREIN